MEKYSVLLVEDDPNLSKILQLALKRKNIILDLACNGNEALDKLKTKQYDGIISDVSMPECDGLCFIQKMRKNKDYAPVIFYSGHANDEEAKIVQSFGAEGIISKQNVKTIGTRMIELIEFDRSSRKTINKECLSDSSLNLLKEFEDLVFNSNN